MPIRKHKRSFYNHLDSIDDETLERLALSLSGKITPYLVQEPVLIEATENGIPTFVVDGPSTDAFGRLRVSQPTGIFDSQNQYDASPILWESSIVNNSGSAAVTHLPNQSSVRLAVGPNDTVIRQTRQYHRYQPGKSQQMFMTYAPFPAFGNLTQRIGYFDADNGIFLEFASNGVVSIVKRSKATGVVVETRAPRSGWDDSLDGNGPSGHDLDLTKAQLFFIDLEWLGVGRVRVGFIHNGLLHIAHSFLHTNELDGVYMTTANLPLRYEIVGGSALEVAPWLTQICSQISSEGGVELERGHLLAYGNGASLISVTTRRPILSIRPRTTFNSIVNRIFTLLEEAVVVNTGNNPAYYEVVYGGALTGASFASVDANYSAVEADVAATALTGGITIAADYVPSSNQARGKSLREFSARYPFALNIAGAHPTSPLSDIFTVVATGIGGATTLGGTFTWREVR